MRDYSEQFWRILACPFCGTHLQRRDDGAWCDGCAATYRATDTGALDLRLPRQKKCELDFQLGDDLPAEDGVSFEPLSVNPRPEVDYTGIAVPFHLSPRLLSHIPRARSRSSLMLDLGCGSAIHREVMERAGYRYAGLDYDDAQAPLLGDAHALPFENGSFDLVLSIAVLEHIRYPFIAMREAARVLRPGGKLIGTVAFLEPFHLDSYYHHSHLGTLNTLRYAGFEVHQIAPDPHWTGTRAQAFMENFHRMPRRLVSAVIAPTEVARKLWWRARKLKNPRVDTSKQVRNTTGAFTFIASKAADASTAGPA